MTDKLSGILITLNEEKYIMRCLKNILPHVDEMIVVDGGSEDSTIDIAMDMGATVLVRPFQRDFGDQKSFAISKAIHPWIVLVDADEIFEQGLWNVIPHLIAQTKYDIFGFSRKNIYADSIDINPDDAQDPKKWHNWPDIQHRLFRNYVRYSGKLHESPVGWKSSAPMHYISYYNQGSIIHHKTWQRQHIEDDLYFQMRPTDYPERLAREGYPNK